MGVCAFYLNNIFTSPEYFKKKISGVIKQLSPIRHYYDALVFTGLSGGMVAPCIALRYDKQLIAVRKGERRHSSLHIEGVPTGSFRYIILDDKISTGKTVLRIKQLMDKYSSGIFVGVFLWEAMKFYPAPENFLKWVKEYTKEI